MIVQNLATELIEGCVHDAEVVIMLSASDLREIQREAAKDTTAYVTLKIIGTGESYNHNTGQYDVTLNIIVEVSD